MNELEKINEEISKLVFKLEELKKKREELLVKYGRAYKCKMCGKIVSIKPPITFSEHYREGLCYDCWKKKRLQEIRDAWMKILAGAKIVDIKPYDNPHFATSLEHIVVEKDGNKYRIEMECYEDDCELKVFDLNKKVYIDFTSKVGLAL